MSLSAAFKNLKQFAGGLLSAPAHPWNREIDSLPRNTADKDNGFLKSRFYLRELPNGRVNLNLADITLSFPSASPAYMVSAPPAIETPHESVRILDAVSKAEVMAYLDDHFTSAELSGTNYARDYLKWREQATQSLAKPAFSDAKPS